MSLRDAARMPNNVRAAIIRSCQVTDARVDAYWQATEDPDLRELPIEKGAQEFARELEAGLHG